MWSRLLLIIFQATQVTEAFQTQPLTISKFRAACYIRDFNLFANAEIPNIKELGNSADPTAFWNDDSKGPLGGLADRIFMSRFRAKLIDELGRPASDFDDNYTGLIDIIRQLHDSSSPEQVTESSRRVLRSLFPDWPPFAPTGEVGLLYWFSVLFARPFPAFSAKMNAAVTWAAAQWLMGHCRLMDLDDPDVGDGVNQKLLVRRCRYLEEAKCASICVNTCKMPTQAFFNHDMGVPMRMIPDYDSLECSFEFGKVPTIQDEL